jgi:predicted transcriptional regulator
MARSAKRSISLPPELAAQLDRAAAEAGTSVSSWLAGTAARRLKIEAGLAGVTAWEAEAGALTDDERAEGEAWARRVLARVVATPLAEHHRHAR